MLLKKRPALYRMLLMPNRGGIMYVNEPIPYHGCYCLQRYLPRLRYLVHALLPSIPRATLIQAHSGSRAAYSSYIIRVKCHSQSQCRHIMSHGGHAVTYRGPEGARVGMVRGSHYSPTSLLVLTFTCWPTSSAQLTLVMCMISQGTHPPPGREGIKGPGQCSTRAHTSPSWPDS